MTKFYMDGVLDERKRILELIEKKLSYLDDLSICYETNDLVSDINEIIKDIRKMKEEGTK